MRPETDPTRQNFIETRVNPTRPEIFVLNEKHKIYSIVNMLLERIYFIQNTKRKESELRKKNKIAKRKRMNFSVM